MRGAGEAPPVEEVLSPLLEDWGVVAGPGGRAWVSEEIIVRTQLSPCLYVTY